MVEQGHMDQPRKVNPKDNPIWNRRKRRKKT